jgi:exopolysaccharide biosynthesis protein
MDKMLRFFSKKYRWAVIMAVLLILSTTFTMLDALVIPKSYAAVVQPGKSSESSAQSMLNVSKTADGSDDGSSTADASDADDSIAGDSDALDSGSSDALDISGSDASDSSDSDTLDDGSSASGNSTSGGSGSNSANTSVDASASTSTSQSKAVTSDHSYKDDNISINVEKVDENGAVFYVADIQVSDVSYLKTALANNTFGKNITQTTSEMAEENNAIFAINGDYYGFRDTGLIIRNGVLYRDSARGGSDNKALTVDSTGNLEIVTEGDTSGASLVESGVLQSFSFGPVLVQDGQTVDASSSRVSQRENPRTAIGQIAPLHYLVIVADGRSSESSGMTLQQLAQEFVERGATVAYNLDGGGSSTMWLNGKVINSPTDGHRAGERSVSDIIYIGREESP